MKKLFTILTITLFFALSSNVLAQLAKDSWGFGFGASYPRLTNHSANIYPDALNWGGYLTLQRNFTEHTSIRMQGRFNQLSYEHGPNLSLLGNTNLFSLNFDMLYTFVPCESLSPYIYGGVGAIYMDFDSNPISATVTNNWDNNFDYQINVGLGLDLDISDNWSVNTELGFHQAPTTGLDGNWGTGPQGGLFGAETDAYMSFNLGLMYTFSKGEASKYCQLYDGINVDVPEVDYERIENIVKKHIPEIIEKEVVVQQPMRQQNWVLVGVNFDFNKATLQSESYPILFHAVQVLLMNPDMKVEIEGHTDSIGSEEYNMKLGERRAQTVKDYLTSRGVSADRLTTRSYGESQPIADNKTSAGRAINRRVEFKVLN